jgi:hypothetical protein
MRKEEEKRVEICIIELRQMDNEEIEELFGPLRAAGWNPRMIDSSVVRYDNSVAAGYL